MMLLISMILGSNNPKVLGIVSMKTHAFSSAFARRSSTSTFPNSSVFTVTTSNPAIAAEAGLVP